MFSEYVVDSSIIIFRHVLNDFKKSLIGVYFGNVFILEQVLGNRDRFQKNCPGFELND